MSDETPLESNGTEPNPGSLERRVDATPDLPFKDLKAPAPIDAAPAPPARWLAFVGVLVGGLLGGLVGYGIGDILYPDSAGAALGALAGGLTGAIGVGVLANLTLRAMNEWTTANHPEAKVAKANERQWTRRRSA